MYGIFDAPGSKPPPQEPGLRPQLRPAPLCFDSSDGARAKGRARARRCLRALAEQSMQWYLPKRPVVGRPVDSDANRRGARACHSPAGRRSPQARAFAFQRQLSAKRFFVAFDSSDGEIAALAAEANEAISLCEIPLDTSLVPFLRMSDIAD